MSNMDSTAARGLTELVERLEKATGPDRELDALIFIHVNGWSVWRSKHGYWQFDGPGGSANDVCWSNYGSMPPKFDPDTGKKNPAYDEIPYTQFASARDVPEYTSSLDAARSLMPTHTLWASGLMEDGPFCRVIAPMPNGGYVGGYSEAVGAATVEIATAIAALKARLALLRAAASPTPARVES